jgi:hypothetical protein
MVADVALRGDPAMARSLGHAIDHALKHGWLL